MTDRYLVALRLLRKLLHEADVIVNDGGYLVLEDSNGDPMGMMTKCVDLSDEEFALCRELIGPDGSH
jgi:predicted enzyme related to lactoylglutathione lyase